MDKLSLDEATDEDIVETINGVQVAIEKSVLEQTEGVILDYERSNGGEGLTLKGANECC